MTLTGVPAGRAKPFDRARFTDERLAVVLFPDSASAECNVAGLPAAARVLRELTLAGVARCAISVPGGWSPDRATEAEMERLAGSMPFECMDSTLPAAFGTEKVLIVAGEHLVPADEVRRALLSRIAWHRGLTVTRFGAALVCSRASRAAALARLRLAGCAIVAATAKPDDGIVSRYINRPISQAISRVLLRWPGIRPIHATVACALLAAAMVFTLMFGGAWGLVAGAVLFQAASIVDGVDGEIARATFRTSDRGAKLDSLVDAATNLGFLAGVAVNLWRANEAFAALACVVAGVLLALGLTLIARVSRGNNRPFSFNAVKERVGEGKSRVMTVLAWITSRDFFALATAILIVAGFAPYAMPAFAATTAGWFVATVIILTRRAA